MPAPRLHALTWVVWAVAAVVSVELAPNVLYAALVLLVAYLVVATHGLATPLARTFGLLVALGGVFAAVRVLLSLLTTHGVGIPLVTLPDATVPRFFGGFTVGGTVEREVLLQAGSEAFAIVVVIAVFAAWNAVVSHHEVLRSVPRAFHELGLVVTVALAFVPSLVAALRSVQEADRARTGGDVVRRGRLRRTVVPVLESALERALALAESMDSRGFGRGAPSAAERAAGWCALGGLAALAGAVVALVGRATAAATASGLAGALLVLGALAFASRGSPRVRYRPRPLSRLDAALMAVVLLAPAGLALLAAAGNPTLVWDAWASRPPGFDLRAAAALLALAAPALAAPVRAAAPETVLEPAR